jgi:hypothetical protein
MSTVAQSERASGTPDVDIVLLGDFRISARDIIDP